MTNRSLLLTAALAAGQLLCGTPAFAANQTATFTALSPATELPFRVEVRVVDTGAMALPTLHSYSAAEYDGKWILFGGRTNGLHGFEETGSLNFPAASQSTDVWVIDPVTRQSWHRSLSDAASGLNASAVAALTISDTQTLQQGDNFYLVGGYGRLASGATGTLDTLTAVSLPGMVNWAMGGAGSAEAFVRQTSDPALTVTGGGLIELNGRMQLVMGHNFQGEYTPGRSGTYTRQIRSFDLVDDGTTVRADNWSATPVNNSHRRRDLNIVPVIRPDGAGGTTASATALSGVFTATDGVWTVPVEIDANGLPSMANATASTTFKQGFNGYKSATASVYSGGAGTVHQLLFGGLSLQSLDPVTGLVHTDNEMPFVNDITAISVDADGRYSQRHLGYLPVILDQDGKPLRFGTNADFFASDEMDTFENGVIRLDAITGVVRLGYIFGGVQSNSPNTRVNGVPVAGALTGASNLMFEVVLVPVPEPSTTVLAVCGLGCITWWRRRALKHRPVAGA